MSTSVPLLNYDWDFSAVVPYWRPLLSGLEVTIELTVATAVVGTVLGFGFGFLLRMRIPALRWALTIAVDVIRSLPILVLLLAANYYLPALVGNPGLSPFTIALSALSLNLTVFVADVVRGAIDNVPIGEIEAARAVGFRERDVTWRFIVPAVVRLSLPSLALLYIATAKSSSLASLIAVYELTYTANLIVTERMRTLEAFAVLAAIYVVVVLPFSLLARRLEHRNRPGIEEVG